MAIPYCNDARAACGTLYAESEIASLVLQAPSSFSSLQYVLLATEIWAGAWEQGYTSVVNVNQNLACP